MISKKEYRAAQRQRRRKLKSLVLMFLGSALLLWVGVVLVKPYLPVPGVVPEVKGGPSLKVERGTVDLGDVRFESPVGATFQVTNVGDQPLKFTKSPFVEVLEGC